MNRIRRIAIKLNDDMFRQFSEALNSHNSRELIKTDKTKVIRKGIVDFISRENVIKGKIN